MKSTNADRNDYGFEETVERAICRAASVKPRITVFTASYPPAYLRGGPARSVHALAEALAAEFRFSVVTSASDSKTATKPMQSIEPNRWTTFERATIWYEARRRMPARTVAKLLKQTEPQLVYLNSLFDYRFTILPLLIVRAMFWRVPIVLAPRGELSAGALALKSLKKRAFIAAFRLFKLHKAITWHASTSQEKADINRVFGANVKIQIAIDLRKDLFGNAAEKGWPQRIVGERPGSSLVFFSRIVPKKNVAAVIQAMLILKSDARLSIAGPIEDINYWNRCLRLISRASDSRLIKYVGTIPSRDVVDFLNGFDLLVLPTLGENFGHVVLESLAAGTPVIVGRDTPWHQIETAGAGWICDPTSPRTIAELIERFLALNGEAQERMRVAAHGLALAIMRDPNSVNANRSMFCALISNESP